MSYQDRMVKMSPGWLQDPNGQALLRGFGAGLDELLSDYKDAIKARFPTYAATNGDDYALALLGSDSSLPRYPSETDAQYGERLQQRWIRYDRAGAAARLSDGSGCPIVEDLEGIGFGDISLIEYRDWPADGADPEVHHSPGEWYDSTGVTPWWSRIWVFVGTYDGAEIPATDPLGVFTLGVDRLGFDLPSEPVSSAIDAILRWKPAHVLAVYIAFLTYSTPIESALGIGELGVMVLGAAGPDPGVSRIYINR